MTTYGTIPTSSSPAGSNLDYISRAKARFKAGFSMRRPWKEMFNYRSVGIPAGLSDAIGRIKTNLSYFRVNYAIIVLLILFLSLLWHPISLIVYVIMMAAWVFLYFLRDEPIVILSRTIDDRIVLIVLSVLTLVFLFLTDVTANILFSLLIGAVVILIHAAFRKTDDLFGDEEAGPMYAGIPSSSS